MLFRGLDHEDCRFMVHYMRVVRWGACMCRAHACVHACMRTYIRTCMVPTYIHTYIHAYIPFIYVCVCARVYTYIHVYAQCTYIYAVDR